MIKDIIKKFKLYKRTCWKVTDYLMEIHTVNDEQKNPVDDKDTDVYTCIRDLAGYSLYIPNDCLEMFYNTHDFYCKEYQLINLTEMKRHRQKRNYNSDVYDKITPATVKLKCVDYLVINDKKIYLIYTTDLDYSDDLYNDLLNYHKVESRY